MLNNNVKCVILKLKKIDEKFKYRFQINFIWNFEQYIVFPCILIWEKK